MTPEPASLSRLPFSSADVYKRQADVCIALRTDIDALPVQEETGLPYSSQVPGMMHACGHDMHASMMLGVAKYLCSNRDKFAGTVKLIFQPSEDTLPGGAKELVEKGVMENPHVDAIFGMHLIPDEKEKMCIRDSRYIARYIRMGKHAKYQAKQIRSR